VISGLLSYSIPMVPRYLIILAPVYFIGIALAYLPVYRLINNRGVVYGLIAVIVLLSVTTLFFTGYYTQYSKDDWRGFSGGLQQLTAPGDFIVVVPGYVLQPLNYYYSNTTDRTFEFGAYTAADLDAIAAKKTNATTVYYVVTADISSADPSGDAITWLQGHATQAGQNSGIYLFKSV
jgi:mannosyltransferase